ncbi:helix-turn-helix domain-containing protein [Streptococcus parasuis]|uniref:helix-turn-helix domain-containing protein n=1 Tax=Streptococcus parasuis TaxID=1501662 RepID=UPI004063F247
MNAKSISAPTRQPPQINNLISQYIIPATTGLDIPLLICATLCKCFKERTGQTIFQYLNQYRIHKSIYLLEQTNKYMIEIALDCGYESDSYYIKQFRKQMNQTPKQYRKLFQKIK